MISCPSVRALRPPSARNHQPSQPRVYFHRIDSNLNNKLLSLASSSIPYTNSQLDTDIPTFPSLQIPPTISQSLRRNERAVGCCDRLGLRSLGRMRIAPMPLIVASFVGAYACFSLNMVLHLRICGVQRGLSKKF